MNSLSCEETSEKFLFTDIIKNKDFHTKSNHSFWARYFIHSMDKV